MRYMGARLSRAVADRRALAAVIVVAAVLAGLAAIRWGFLDSGMSSPASAQPVHGTDWAPSYSQEVEPIFVRNCLRCHGPQRADKGLRLDSYQRTMAGDSYGTVVIPGDSSLSAMVSVLRYGTMPHGGSRLSPAEIDAIARWIDSGAPDN